MYFFDSYAIVEILKRNPAYRKYDEYPAIFTILNKMEICWWALNNHDENLMIAVLNMFSQPALVDDDTLKDAILLRKKYIKRKLSYVDAIGYTYAQKNNLLFLTGDEQFKDLPGVEFVK